MASKKSPITQAAALKMAAEILAHVDVAAYLTDALEYDGATVANAAAVLSKMAAQKAKPAVNNDPDGFTKARREANDEVEAAYAFIRSVVDSSPEPTEDEPEAGSVTSVQIRDAIPTVLTTQKAVKLAGYLIEEGRAERVRVGSKVYYRAK